ncbi:MAG TPA: hypothetical protein VJ600_01980 [Holophagaceae bacterium]|nr:hypothetical protein [Holophagaceae bacterium]
MKRVLLPLLGLSAVGLRADHGPGTSGGGLSVMSGEVLRPGAFSLDWRSDYTAFRSLDDAGIAAKAADAGGIDLLDHSWLHSVSLGVGLTETVQLSATVGWYAPSGGATASVDPATGAVTRVANDPRGLTDLWINAKWAVYKGPAGRLALTGGVKLPTGKKDVRDASGDPVDFASTPGSGATDFQAGLGYSTFLTAHLTLDASVARTFRGTYRGYRLGDRTDAGAALAWRLTDSIRSYPQGSLFLELNYRDLDRVRDQGVTDGNSGGRALFTSPGFRLAFSPRSALTLAGQLPLRQSPNGAQTETRFKAVVALSFSF